MPPAITPFNKGITTTFVVSSTVGNNGPNRSAVGSGMPDAVKPSSKGSTPSKTSSVSGNPPARMGPRRSDVNGTSPPISSLLSKSFTSGNDWLVRSRTLGSIPPSNPAGILVRSA